MTVARALSAASSMALFLVACTGGPGELPGSDGGSGGGSSSGSTSSSSSSSSSSTSSSGGTNTTIKASDFDQSCTTAADCAPIYEGAICTPCACPNAAIAKKDLAKYNDTRADADCPPTGVQCDACSPPAVTCAGGKCAINR